MCLKSNKGVTLMALVITVIVMLIISGTIIYKTNSYIRIQKVDKLYTDISNLSDKIDEYYLNNGDIPILSNKYCNKSELSYILSHNASLNSSILNKTNNSNLTINPNDSDSYYIIDVEKLDGLTLNYGYSTEFKNAKSNSSSIYTSINDIYIINELTHQIYYPHGIFANGIMYYTYDLDTNEF